MVLTFNLLMYTCNFIRGTFLKSTNGDGSLLCKDHILLLLLIICKYYTCDITVHNVF